VLRRTSATGRSCRYNHRFNLRRMTQLLSSGIYVSCRVKNSLTKLSAVGLLRQHLATMPVSMPINTLKGNWQRLVKNDRLKRSSQVLSVVGDKICIYGGEVQPRQPVDDQIDILSISAGMSTPPNINHQGTPKSSTY
jgi:hypothetical protein